MFNKVILLGRLTKDPELRYTPSGSSICNLNLALDHRYTKDGETKKETVFINNIAVWGKIGENCAEYLQKGSQVLIEGRLKLDQWEDNDGNKKSALVVVANIVQFLGNKKSNNNQGNDDNLLF